MRDNFFGMRIVPKRGANVKALIRFLLIEARTNSWSLPAYLLKF